MRKNYKEFVEENMNQFSNEVINGGNKLIAINKYPRNPLLIFDYIHCQMKEYKRGIRISPYNNFLAELYHEYKHDGIDFYFMNYNNLDGYPYEINRDKELSILKDYDPTYMFLEIVINEYNDSDITRQMREELGLDKNVPKHIENKIKFLNKLLEDVDVVLFYGDYIDGEDVKYYEKRFEDITSFSNLIYHYVRINNELEKNKIELIELE